MITMTPPTIAGDKSAHHFAKPSADSAEGETSRPTTEGIHAFAFQTGEWRVAHRKLRKRLANCTDWVEFEGSCTAWELMGGHANVDDHVLHDPAGTYRAATIRRRDLDTGLWSIWWFDSRFAALDPPVVGSFRDGVGTFFASDRFEGRPVEVRFTWSEISRDAARWEQAFSPDGGASWETNWIMAFRRLA
jgi:hypothetical protein